MYTQDDGIPGMHMWEVHQHAGEHQHRGQL